MIDEKTKVPNRTQYEIIDRDGNVHGPMSDMDAIRSYVKMHWPDQAQDEDRTGKGWDVQVEGCE